MHLTPTGPSEDSSSAVGTPRTRALIQSAVNRHAAAENENTRRTYRAGWNRFVRFCKEDGHTALPATGETVTVFMEHLAREGYALATIDTRITAIADRHKSAGEEDPTKTHAVRQQRENLRKTLDPVPDQVEPVLLEHLRAMAFNPDTLSDVRDRALLFVGFAGGFRRSELTGLTIDDLREVSGGIVLRVRRSKTDQEGRGRMVQIPDRVPALSPTPNEALREWLDAAEIDAGPLFRMVDRWENVREGALSGQAVYTIVRGWMESIGEDPSDYGAHSLRAGYATQGYIDRIGEHEIAQQTGHRKLDTLRQYQRVHVVMEDHPLSRMGTGSQ